MIVNQWVPAAHKGDAIGDSARRVRDLLRAMGHESELYALTDRRRPAATMSGRSAIRRRRRGDVTIFHYALPSPMTDGLRRAASRARPAVPQRDAGAYFAPYDPALFRLASLGRDELATLAGRVDLALGDSEYNRAGARGARLRPHRRVPDCGRHRADHAARRGGRRSKRFSTTAS